MARASSHGSGSSRQGRPGMMAAVQWRHQCARHRAHPFRRPDMYDLVLKGGRVVDPSSGFDGVLDVAVDNGVIAQVAAGIAPADASRVIEVGGKLVTPGLIDLHAHVFEGVNRTGVNPDLGGVYSGVTTIVDAGSAGAATFAAFPRHILPHCHTEVIPFLHICQ